MLSSTQTIPSGLTFPVWKMFRGGKDTGEDEVCAVVSDVSPPSDSPVSAFIQHPRAFAWGLSVEGFVLWDGEVICSWEKQQQTGNAIQYFENVPLSSWDRIWPQRHQFRDFICQNSFGLWMPLAFIHRWICKYVLLLRYVSFVCGRFCWVTKLLIALCST